MLKLKLFNSFSDELASTPGGCLSVSEEEKKALKTELAQVTSTNSPLNPLFQNPSWKGNEFGKESGVTGAHRMLHAGYRANRILNSTEGPQGADVRNEIYMQKSKISPCKLVIYACLSYLWTEAARLIARGHSVEFRFNKLLCLWSHRAQIAESAGLYVSQPCLHTWGEG